MQPTTEKQTDWDSTDAATLRTLLESPTFKKAFQIVADACPALLDGGDVNRTLVRSGEVKGFQFAFSELFNLTTEQPTTPQPSEAYPSLDDESKWKDSPGEAS